MQCVQTLVMEFVGRTGPALPWFHLGGDEVSSYACWDADPPTRAWAATLGCPSLQNASVCVRAEMARRLEEMLASHALRAVFWEEALHYGVTKPGIIAPWFTGSCFFGSARSLWQYFATELLAIMLCR